MSAAYDEIVTLGCDCTATLNLRRTLKLRNAFPFDWWTTPLDSLARFLKEPSVETLYDLDLLEPRWRGDAIDSVCNRHYDIELRHEFPRGEDGAVRPDWRDHIGAPRSRSQHLLGRFLALPRTAKSVLFVRSFKSWELERLCGRAPRLIGEVRETLAALLPGLDFQLLLVDPPARVELPGVRSVHVGDVNTGDWRGTPEAWRSQLLGAGIAWLGADPDLRGGPERESGLSPA